VAFEDLSTNIPTSWDWDFGDLSIHGTTQNPSHTYAAEGKYKVKLTATNAGGSSIFSYDILVSTTAAMNVTIEQMVKGQLPVGITMTDIMLSQEIRKWQIYLQPLVEVPFTVLVADTFTQSKWPSLTNVLIAKLIIYEQFQAMLRQVAANAVSQSTSNASGTTTTTSAGGIKSIESGPSKVEWHDPQSTISEIIRNAASSGASSKEGSLAGEMQLEVCMMANRQRIYLPNLCPPVNRTKVFTVGKKPRRRIC
jgi:PKD repeat protein